MRRKGQHWIAQQFRRALSQFAYALETELPEQPTTGEGSDEASGKKAPGEKGSPAGAKKDHRD